MSYGILTLISGVASTAQDFVTILDNTMVHSYGWELVSKVVDTPSIKEYWWRSEGEVAGARMSLYCGALASGTNVYTRAATTVSGSVVHDLMADNLVSVVPWLDNKKFWIAGNKDFVHFFSDLSDVHHAGGFGYLDTFYDYKSDPYPVCVYGQTTFSGTFADSHRLLAYTPSLIAIATASGVAGGGFLATTASGAFDVYTSDNYGPLLQLNAPSLRDGRYTALRQIFYIPESTSLFTSEARGNLAFSWQVWNGDSFIGQPVTASGFLFDSNSYASNATFVVSNEFGEDDNTYLIGPCTEFRGTDKGHLYNIPGMKLFLEGDRGIERTFGSFHGGKVNRWRDQSWHPKTERITRNDAVQSTLSNQPTPVDNVLNSHSIVQFSSTANQYLTGTVPVSVSGSATFVVASYSSGSSRTPLINIRGNLGGEDTSLSLEFNETTSNSATIINNAGGGTVKYEWTGLSPDTSYILTNAVSGTDGFLYVNGLSTSSFQLNNNKGLPSSSGTLNYSLGVNLNSGGSVGSIFSNSKIAEVIYFNNYLTNEERNAIHSILGTKYNISVSSEITPIPSGPPRFQAAGAFQAAAGGTNITIPWPAHEAGDIGLLWLQNYNQAAFNLLIDAGFVNIVTVAAGLPSGVDPTHQSGVFWCRATSNSMTSPVLENANFAGASDYSLGIITTYRGCISTGNPWNTFTATTDTVNNITVDMPSVTTTVPNTLIVFGILGARSTSTTFNNDLVNANLTSIGDYVNNVGAVGNGGNINTATGIKLTPGSIGTTSGTYTGGQSHGDFVIALRP